MSTMSKVHRVDVSDSKGRRNPELRLSGSRHQTSKDQRLTRAFGIFLHVLTCPDRVSTASLAECYQTSRRTVFRDMELLRRIGINIHYDRRAERFRIVELDSFRQKMGVPAWPLSLDDWSLILAILELAAANSDRELIVRIERLKADVLGLMKLLYPESGGTMPVFAKMLELPPRISIGQLHRLLKSLWKVPAVGPLVGTVAGRVSMAQDSARRTTAAVG